MNFGDMQTEVKRRFAENVSDVTWASAQDIKDAINDGLEAVTEMALWREKNVTLPLGGGSMYWDMREVDPQFMLVTSVFNSQNKVYMTPDHWRRMDAAGRWDDLEGEPHTWFVRGGWWLGVFPRPSATSGTIKVYYKAMADRMVNDSEDQGFAEEFQYAILDYALYDLLSQDDETEKALQYWKLFMDQALRFRNFVGARPELARTGVIGGR